MDQRMLRMAHDISFAGIGLAHARGEQLGPAGSLIAPLRRLSRHARVALVSGALCLLLVVMALAIGLTQSQSRTRTLANFQLRAQSSATFISTFIAQTRTARHGLGSLSASTLAAFVDHAVPFSPHESYLIDARGRLLAASPRTRAPTLQLADPNLARAVAHATNGSVETARAPSMFATASVPGSAWKLILVAPDSRLYASIGGLVELVPWIVFALVGVFGVSLVVLFSRSLASHSKLAALSQELERVALTDDLTGLSNRRALSERLTEAIAQARRQREPLSVLMIDLDCFKQINDSFGHDAGDRVLAAVGRLLRSVFRSSDIFGRWGGDEFLVVLPTTDERGAQMAAERLLEAARKTSASDLGFSEETVDAGDANNGNEQLTLSIGSATGTYTTAEQLLQQADEALYESKAMGRDRITIAGRSAHVA